jgi:CheY-like chemotaxis protein
LSPVADAYFAYRSQLLAAFLKKNKMMYKEAGNGEEAVQAYENASPVRFDVVLMGKFFFTSQIHMVLTLTTWARTDVSMPVMDGMSATRAIREYEQKNNLPRCHIIALTGLASASARLEAWSSGVDHYMTKPVNFKKLQAVLKDEVAKKLTNTEGGKQDLDAAAPSIKPASP